MKLYLASDHGAYKMKEVLKEELDKQKIDYEDMGTHSEDSVDYPDIAKTACEKILSDEKSRGILMCGTGIGISISANKIKGIRAALCHNEFTAEMASMHNNANVLCMGGRVLDNETAIKVMNKYLNTKFEGGRHERRVDKIMDLEC